jgi:hypothetical protein
MTLDQVCARPNAGAALLHLHRWLPLHGACVVNLAFNRTTVLPRVQFAAADMTAFTVLAELAEVLKAAPNPDSLVDRALLLLEQEDGFHEVREFLAMQAAVREASRRIKAPEAGPIVLTGCGQASDYLLKCKACLETLGIPAEWSVTNADGSPYRGRQS